MSLLDTFIKWQVGKRVKHIKTWREDPIYFQNKFLKKLIKENSHTEFGKKYNIKNISNYSDFHKKIPIFSYEDFFPWIEKTMKGEEDIITHHGIYEYAKSSGTTNDRSKYIPTPRSYMKRNHREGGLDMLANYIYLNPKTKIYFGSYIAVSGTLNKNNNDNFISGDISALISRSMPWYTKFNMPYKKKLALHPSWSYKSKEIINQSLTRDVRSLVGTSTWMLEMLEYAKEITEAKSLHDVWPNLEVFFHGAVAFAPYKKAFDELFPDKPINYRDVYNSAEGIFAFEDDAESHPRELLLLVDHDVYYEFIEMKDCLPVGNAVPLSDVKIGIEYAMIITTGSGLWRYMIGDTVVFVNISPYRLRIVGRTKYFINAFGEELVASNAEQAIEKASKECGAIVRAFTAAPIFYKKTKTKNISQGAHEWAVEFANQDFNFEKFCKTLDENLREINSDYDSKRIGDVILGAPVVYKIKEGTFRAWMESRGKLGGQHKVPVLSNERKYIDAVLNRSKI